MFILILLLLPNYIIGLAFSPTSPSALGHLNLLSSSLHKHTCRSLLSHFNLQAPDESSPLTTNHATRIFEDRQIVLLSHTTAADPVFNYANLAGQVSSEMRTAVRRATGAF